MKWLLALLLFVCWPAFADDGNKKLSMSDHNGKLILNTKTPCKQGPWFKNWRAASWFFQGKPYEACWKLQNNAVVVMDSDGDITTHNPRTFVEDVGV